MKIGVIDIGSNSVRLMLWADGKTLYKKLCTTRLGEGLNSSPYLKVDACIRTAQAVKEFYGLAAADGADKVYSFATAAVRSSRNPEEFLNRVKAACGADVDVISGEVEAKIGLFGALGDADGGIIDVGGASTEVTVRSAGDVKYFKSVNVGTVRIFDAAGRNLDKINKFVSAKIEEYGDNDFSEYKMYAIGGSAFRLGAIKLGIKNYGERAVDGVVLSKDEARAYSKTLTDMPVEEIRAKTICGNSADVIGGGAALLAAVMDKLKIEKVTVSESDNLEGYLMYKLSGQRG